ncbi:MAG: protein adenylyltransferase SelO [Pyrinomonadaceae bacterium]
MRKLTELQFDNTYARLPETFRARVKPTPLKKSPHLVSFNEAAAPLLDLDPREAERPEFVEYFGGGKVLPGADPVAMLYAGHQFGSYVPQLGDGRAILLGEVRNASGEKWDVQLKGSGPTPFSRGFDGRAVLRSTIREYLCGEAMHYLGIPTTRALCIVASDDAVRRESVETAAILTRLSPSHVRFGTFEVFYYRNQPERVRELADYVIANYYPELAGTEDRYEQFLREVVRRTANMIAQWQAVGFAHGVMNTDNMSVLGLTIDYGPFGFVDDYQTHFIPNHSDHSGRYSLGQQPAIGLWNLSCLAQTLLSLITREQAVAAFDTYQPLFAEHYGQLIRQKLGLREERDEDSPLVIGLLGLLEANGVDYTNFFRRLGRFDTAADARNDLLRDMFVEPAAFDRWAADYGARLLSEQSDDAERRERMDKANPKYVLRNYLAQEAIKRAVETRDYTEIERLLELLRRPFDEQPGMERYAEAPPDWGEKIIVSCSS